MITIEINGSDEKYYLPESWAEVSPKAFREFLNNSNLLTQGKINDIEYMIRLIQSFMNIDDVVWDKFDPAAQMALIKELSWLENQDELQGGGNIKISK